MQVFQYIHRWLGADPPGTNHLVAAVFAVALIWVVFERVGSGISRSR
jgi:hypothetical protein